MQGTCCCPILQVLGVLNQYYRDIMGKVILCGTLRDLMSFLEGKIQLMIECPYFDTLTTSEPRYNI